MQHIKQNPGPSVADGSGAISLSVGTQLYSKSHHHRQGLRHVSSPLEDLLARIGLRAIRHHMELARKCEGRPEFRADGKAHVREAVGIQETMKAQRLGPFKNWVDPYVHDFAEAA